MLGLGRGLLGDIGTGDVCQPGAVRLFHPGHVEREAEFPPAAQADPTGPGAGAGRTPGTEQLRPAVPPARPSAGRCPGLPPDGGPELRARGPAAGREPDWPAAAPRHRQVGGAAGRDLPASGPAASPHPAEPSPAGKGPPAGPAPPAGGGRYPERRRGRPWPPGGSTGFPPGDSPRLPHRPAAAGGSP